jgi:hypothetical protein
MRFSFRQSHVCGSAADHWSLSCGQPRHRADVTAADVPLLLEFCRSGTLPAIPVAPPGCWFSIDYDLLSILLLRDEEGHCHFILTLAEWNVGQLFSPGRGALV